jgi:hypothetical protein
LEGERGEPDRVLQDSWTIAKNPWLVDLAIGSATTSAPEAPRFLPVELSEAALAGPKAVDPVDQRIEIALPGGVAVRVGRGFDAEALHRVLTVLGR